MTPRSERPRAPSAVLSGLAVLLAASAATAQDRTVSAGVTVRVVSGTFGSENRSHVVYVPAILRVDSGRLELSGFFPYVTIDDGTVALSQGGFVPMQGSLSSSPNAGMSMSGHMGGTSPVPGAPNPPNLAAVSQSGLGDVVGSVGYRLVDRPGSGLQVAVTGRFKLPTASASRGLGTGRADAGVSAAVRRQLDAGWMYAEAGYVRIGDPDGVDLRNTVLWSVGGGRRLTERVFLLGSAYGNTAILPEFGAPAEIGAGVGVRVAEHLNLTVLPSVGVSRASPSYGITVGLSTRVWRREKL